MRIRTWSRTPEHGPHRPDSPVPACRPHPPPAPTILGDSNGDSRTTCPEILTSPRISARCLPPCPYSLIDQPIKTTPTAKPRLPRALSIILHSRWYSLLQCSPLPIQFCQSIAKPGSIGAVQGVCNRRTVEDAGKKDGNPPTGSRSGRISSVLHPIREEPTFHFSRNVRIPGDSSW
jgi:hypothetical protein